MLNEIGTIEKGWGSEYIWASNDKYCAKFLNFNEGAKFSMHFHSQKDETWYVLKGSFEIELIDTSNASTKTFTLFEGSTWRNMPLVPHRLTCIEKGTIIEVSTPDHKEDNYRVFPGDSQK